MSDASADSRGCRDASAGDAVAPLVVRRFDVLPYREALQLQEDLVARRARGEIADTLLLLEHPPTLTAGRKTMASSRPANDDVGVIETNRGGDITWHGPGQTVGYWIRKLDGDERDLHAHLRTIEGRLIAAVAAFGVHGERVPGKTGVWASGKKIASIGVAVRSWVAYHGFSLNRDVGADVYDTFRPCGLDRGVMSDLRRTTGHPVPRGGLEVALQAAFERLYRS